MANAYFSQLERNIESLISENKFRDAHKLTAQALTKFPDERVFLKLKRKIEKLVEKGNSKYIGEQIAEAKELWRQESYIEMIEKLQKLLKVSPNNKKITKLIFKAQKKYKNKIEKIQSEFDKNQNKRLTELFKKEPAKLLDELFQLEKNNPGNRQVRKLTEKYRTQLIKQKIEKKEDLLYSDKYDAINNFIYQLRKIDKTNPEINKLENQIKLRQHGAQIEEKNEYIYKGGNHITTLLKLKKYNEAIKAAEELLALKKNNKRVRKLLAKAENKAFTENKNTIVEMISKNFKTLKEERHLAKNEFIKI